MALNPFKVGDKVRQKPKGQQITQCGADLGYLDCLGDEDLIVTGSTEDYISFRNNSSLGNNWCHERFELVESVTTNVAPELPKDAPVEDEGKIVWVLYNPLLKKIDSICSTRSVARSRKTPDQRVKKAKITILGD